MGGISQVPPIQGVAPATPTGVLLPFAGSAAPGGWLLADGTPISRTTYAALFAVIGTTYGVGDGSTTFNLPNMQGRIPVGRDAAQTEFDTLGETGGAKTVALSTAEMPSHAHVQNAHTHGQDYHSHTSHIDGNVVGYNGGVAGGFYFGGNQAPSHYDYTGFSATDTLSGGAIQSATPTEQTAGSGTAHQNLQPYTVLNYIIKV